MSLNNVVISGRLTRDAAARALPSGGKIVNFTVAVNDFYIGKDGKKNESVNYIDCNLFAQNEEFVKRFNKGTGVTVLGKLKQENWTDKDNNKRSKVVIRVDKVEFLGTFTKEAKVEVANDDLTI